MTNLEKAVRRKLPEENIVVEITRAGVRTREARRRTWYGPYPWAQLHLMLARLTADQRIAGRRKRRGPARRRSARLRGGV